MNVSIRLLKFIEENNAPLLMIACQEVVESTPSVPSDIWLPRTEELDFTIEDRTIYNLELQREETSKASC